MLTPLGLLGAAPVTAAMMNAGRDQELVSVLRVMGRRTDLREVWGEQRFGRGAMVYYVGGRNLQPFKTADTRSSRSWLLQLSPMMG